MNVTRDVILDLLPLYLAGEASPATRALVDDFLKDEPVLGETVRRQQAAMGESVGRPAVPLDLEVRALRRTRYLLAWQRWSFASAWFFTAIALSARLSIEHGQIRRFDLLLFEFPIALGAALLAAVGSWAAYYGLRRRTRHAV